MAKPPKTPAIANANDSPFGSHRAIESTQKHHHIPESDEKEWENER